MGVNDCGKFCKNILKVLWVEKVLYKNESIYQGHKEIIQPKYLQNKA